MPNLLPFRDYSEHEVINLFACNVIANKGTLVVPVRSWKDDGGGVDNSIAGPVKLGPSAPGAIYPNTVSHNFELVGSVTTYNSSVPGPIGVLLKDVREFDENGRKLVFDPRKAAEMDVIIKDIQAVPILTRGLILVNDIDTGGGAPDAGDAAYAGSAGRFATTGLVPVGRFLSRVDENGYALVKLSIP
jgi:hypothetical protein